MNSTSAGLPVHAVHLTELAQALSSGQTRHLSLPGNRAVSVSGGAFPKLRLPGRFSEVWPRPDFAAPPEWTLRRRQAGDRIRLSGGERKLSDVLTDLRVPRSERGEVWVLAAAEGGVQWVGTRPPIWALGAREAMGAAPDPDHFFMGEALRLAHTAAAQGEVPVGAVVVRAGPEGSAELVAGAFNRSRAAGDMTRHAELGALRAAAERLGPYLDDCTLYVTLEPCPMCLGAAIEARLGRLVYAASNPRAGALGGVSDLLSNTWGHAFAVTPGVRAAEASRLLRATFAGFRGSRSST